VYGVTEDKFCETRVGSKKTLAKLYGSKNWDYSVVTGKSMLRDV